MTGGMTPVTNSVPWLTVLTTVAPSRIGAATFSRLNTSPSGEAAEEDEGHACRALRPEALRRSARPCCPPPPVRTTMLGRSAISTKRRRFCTMAMEATSALRSAATARTVESAPGHGGQHRIGLAPARDAHEPEGGCRGDRHDADHQQDEAAGIAPHGGDGRRASPPRPWRRPRSAWRHRQAPSAWARPSRSGPRASPRWPSPTATRPERRASGRASPPRAAIRIWARWARTRRMAHGPDR